MSNKQETTHTLNKSINRVPADARHCSHARDSVGNKTEVKVCCCGVVVVLQLVIISKTVDNSYKPYSGGLENFIGVLVGRV